MLESAGSYYPNHLTTFRKGVSCALSLFKSVRRSTRRYGPPFLDNLLIRDFRNTNDTIFWSGE